MQYLEHSYTKTASFVYLNVKLTWYPVFYMATPYWFHKKQNLNAVIFAGKKKNPGSQLVHCTSITNWVLGSFEMVLLWHYKWCLLMILFS